MWDLIVSVPDHCLSFYSAMDGRLDDAVSIIFLFYVVSISESRHFVCKCYMSRIV